VGVGRVVEAHGGPIGGLLPVVALMLAAVQFSEGGVRVLALLREFPLGENTAMDSHRRAGIAIFFLVIWRVSLLSPRFLKTTFSSLHFPSQAIEMSPGWGAGMLNGCRLCCVGRVVAGWEGVHDMLWFVVPWCCPPMVRCYVTCRPTSTERRAVCTDRFESQSRRYRSQFLLW